MEFYRDVTELTKIVIVIIDNKGLQQQLTSPLTNMKLETWASAQLDGALPNIGGALCSTPQSLADAHY